MEGGQWDTETGEINSSPVSPVALVSITHLQQAAGSRRHAMESGAGMQWNQGPAGMQWNQGPQACNGTRVPQACNGIRVPQACNGSRVPQACNGIRVQACNGRHRHPNDMPVNRDTLRSFAGGSPLSSIGGQAPQGFSWTPGAQGGAPGVDWGMAGAPRQNVNAGGLQSFLNAPRSNPFSQRSLQSASSTARGAVDTGALRNFAYGNPMSSLGGGAPVHSELDRTAAGGGSWNPFLRGSVDAATRDMRRSFNDEVLPGIAQMFGGAGRTGGGAFADAVGRAGGRLTEAIGDTAAGIYGPAAERERDRQVQAARDASGLRSEERGRQYSLFGDERGRQLSAGQGLAGIQAGLFQGERGRQHESALAADRNRLGAAGQIASLRDREAARNLGFFGDERDRALRASTFNAGLGSDFMNQERQRQFDAMALSANLGDRERGRQYSLFGDERGRQLSAGQGLSGLEANLYQGERGRQFDAGALNAQLQDRGFGRQFDAGALNAQLQDRGFGRQFDAGALNAQLQDRGFGRQFDAGALNAQLQDRGFGRQFDAGALNAQLQDRGFGRQFDAGALNAQLQDRGFGRQFDAGALNAQLQDRGFGRQFDAGALNAQLQDQERGRQYGLFNNQQGRQANAMNMLSQLGMQGANLHNALGQTATNRMMGGLNALPGLHGMDWNNINQFRSAADAYRAQQDAELGGRQQAWNQGQMQPWQSLQMLSGILGTNPLALTNSQSSGQGPSWLHSLLGNPQTFMPGNYR